MVTAVIIQARMQSTRLPGKVLMDLAGKTVLSHVIERCRAIPGAEVVCCAVPDTGADDPIAAEAERLEVTVVRGSHSDVLDRYAKAARQVDADVVVRITSDCPAIDPDVCGAVLDLRAKVGAGYATNALPPAAWPDGLDCEVISRDWLERAAREATSAFDREHVTPYIRAHRKSLIAALPCPDGDLRSCRWTLDTEADLRFLRAVFGRLPSGPAGWNWREVRGILQAEPALADINRATA